MHLQLVHYFQIQIEFPWGFLQKRKNVAIVSKTGKILLIGNGIYWNGNYSFWCFAFLLFHHEQMNTT